MIRFGYMEAEPNVLLVSRCARLRCVCWAERLVCIWTGLWSTWNSGSAQTLLPGPPKASWLLELPQGFPEDAPFLWKLLGPWWLSALPCLLNPSGMSLRCPSGPCGKLPTTSEIPKGSPGGQGTE